MNLDSVAKLPVKIRVKELIQSRYANRIKPADWDERKDGYDLVRTEDDKILKLWSDGGQTPPEKGWSLMLSAGDASTGYHWTLYGMTRSE